MQDIYHDSEWENFQLSLNVIPNKNLNMLISQNNSKIPLEE